MEKHAVFSLIKERFAEMFSENVKKTLDVVLKVSAGSHGNQKT